MAASSNKSSPSQKSVDTTVTTTTTAPVGGPKTEGEEPATTSTPETPTYESVQASTRYQVAQTLLQNGDFEDALTTIAEGLEEIKTALGESNGTTVDFHPALAPLHYLYGTTLLYSVEESSSGSMMMAQPSDDGGDGEGPSDDTAEDTQIAFENLDIARLIVEHYLDGAGRKTEDGSSTTSNHQYNPKALQLDLAQIRLREGDLQRLNGQYSAALQDYQACAALRAASPSLGPYDRKLADVHYNLALCHALRVAEAAAAASNTTPEDATKQGSPAAVAAAAKSPLVAAAATALATTASADNDCNTTPTLTPAEMQQGRRQSAYHYLECGRILCGHLAQPHVDDVDAFLRQAVAQPSSTLSTDDGQEVDPTMAGCQLAAWRTHVQTNLPPLDENLVDANLWDVLMEIQESLDEGQASEEGVQQVAHMKASIAAAAAAEHGTNDEASSSGDTANAFGSKAAAAVSATAQPLMAVRKKKRPPPSSADDPPKEPGKQAKPTSE